MLAGGCPSPPEAKRGFFGSIPQIGVTIGLLLGNAAALLANLLPTGQFEAWGWRVPFVFSIVLVAIGLWIRAGLEETPAFRALQDKGQVEKMPLAVTLRDHWRAVLVAIGAKAVETAPFYILVTFVVAYATDKTIGYQRGDVLTAILIGAAVATAVIPLMGSLSDRFGRRPVYMVGVVLLCLSAWIYFPMVNSKSVPMLIVASVLSLGLAWAPVTATLGTMMSETFSANVRYTGITLGYQIGAAIFSGTAPMIALALWKGAGGSWIPVAVYWGIIGVLSLIAAWAAKHVAVTETIG